MTVLFDVVVDGEVKETILPVNQKFREMHWYVVDRVHELTLKHGDNFEICRRVKYV